MSNQTSDNNKRIAKNTLLLYVRMLFMMVISLYTSRVILDKLGEVDFGIYNVVGGVGADTALAVFDYRGADRVGGCLVPECKDDDTSVENDGSQLGAVMLLDGFSIK